MVTHYRWGGEWKEVMACGKLLGNSRGAHAPGEERNGARAPSSAAAGGVWHPSELNSLSACPFIFLARRLKLRASRSPDFEVPIFGGWNLAHSSLRVSTASLCRIHR